MGEMVISCPECGLARVWLFEYAHSGVISEGETTCFSSQFRCLECESEFIYKPNSNGDWVFRQWKPDEKTYELRETGRAYVADPWWKKHETEKRTE